MVKWSFPGNLYFDNTRKNLKSNLVLVIVLVLESKGLYWAIAFNIRTPPVEDSPFLLTPEDWLKLHSPVKTAIKYGFTPEELGHTPKEYGFTHEEFREN